MNRTLCFFSTVFLGALGGASALPAAEPALKPLTVAFSLDNPPYVMEQATKGVEADLLRAALPGREMKVLQLPYNGVQAAITDGKADVAVSVRQFADEADGVYFSDIFVYFQNTAATKKSVSGKIESIADLAAFPVFAWEDASRELGPEFEKQYAPDAPARARYREFGNQADQVRAFWAAPEAVAVIDKNILKYFSQKQGHEMDEVVFHDVFPAVTGFRVAFRDPTLRDTFNTGLKRILASGDYRKIMEKNGVALPRLPGE
ncbi:MAG: transporter substrate-binding domain-containing protein [Verrucomicrobiota bacterium]